MRSRKQLWRRELRLWAVPVALFLLGAAALAVYHATLAVNARSGEQGLSSRRAELDELLAARRELETFAKRAETNHAGLVAFYGERLGTEGERLTRTLVEVQELAQRAGLEPSSFSYPDEPFEVFGLIRRSIVFTVDGSYQELRRFVNFLELSDSFLTLEDVRLSESGKNAAGDLRIALRLSTLFLTGEVDPERLAADPAVVPAREAVGS